MRARAPNPESSRADQPNNTDQTFDGLLPAAIDGYDLLAAVTHLAGDGESRLAIDPLLLARKRSRSRPPCSRRGSAGQFPVALLGVLMTVAVHAVDARPVALVLEAS